MSQKVTFCFPSLLNTSMTSANSFCRASKSDRTVADVKGLGVRYLEVAEISTLAGCLSNIFSADFALSKV